MIRSSEISERVIVTLVWLNFQKRYHPISMHLRSSLFCWIITIAMGSIRATGINGPLRASQRLIMKRIFQTAIVHTILEQIRLHMPAVALSGTTCCERAYLSEILANL